jgi:hypothetical protein
MLWLPISRVQGMYDRLQVTPLGKYALMRDLYELETYAPRNEVPYDVMLDELHKICSL